MPNTNITIKSSRNIDINIDVSTYNVTIPAIPFVGKLSTRQASPAGDHYLHNARWHPRSTHMLHLVRVWAHDDKLIFCNRRSTIGLIASEAERYNSFLFSHINFARKSEDNRLNTLIPGLSELQHAHLAMDNYHAAFNDAMDDEQNDGVNMPRCPTANIDELSRQYPIAALYIRAFDYSCAAHDRKSAAGEQAMEILGAGGSTGSAKALLDTWSTGYSD